MCQRKASKKTVDEPKTKLGLVQATAIHVRIVSEVRDQSYDYCANLVEHVSMMIASCFSSA
jgi:hypothetical protein